MFTWTLIGREFPQHVIPSPCKSVVNFNFNFNFAASNLTIMEPINASQNGGGNKRCRRAGCASPGTCSWPPYHRAPMRICVQSRQLLLGSRNSRSMLCTGADDSQDLPAELFNEIYQLVFSISKCKAMTVNVTNDYKPPVILQVDRRTREKLAEDYYGWSIFCYDGTGASRVRICRWISSLSESHRNCVRFIWRKSYGTTKLKVLGELPQYWLASLKEVVGIANVVRFKELPSFLKRRLCVDAVIRKENDEIYVHTPWGFSSKAGPHSPSKSV